VSAASTTAVQARDHARRTRGWIFAALLGLGLLGALAVLRGGLLGLPGAPRDVTPAAAGLADLHELGERARELAAAVAAARTPSDPVLAEFAAGSAAVQNGDTERGLEAMRAALGRAPGDLVLGNAFRMAVFQLRRAALTDAGGRTTLVARVPAWLEREPIRTLERLHAVHPSRESALQLALGWVDELILFPALEIKAPASVESVQLLTGVLEREPSYVPALYGRGLNYLHRPARLEWPEAKKMAPDAASRDLGLCIAIGRRIGGASPRLVATLALALGDAYAKEGRPDRARSWWQIAANTDRAGMAEATRRRFAWQDDDLLAQLEAELETRMRDFDHPLTDLGFIWQ
jgi:tetratricopeptide (TPR) repeat protein